MFPEEITQRLGYADVVHALLCGEDTLAQAWLNSLWYDVETRKRWSMVDAQWVDAA